MRKILRRLAAGALGAAVLWTPALALSPQELGVILTEQYAGEIPAQVWEQTTVEGMLDALGDPFSRYYTAQEYAAFQAAVNGDGTGEGPAAVTVADGLGRIDLRSFGADTYAILRDGVAAAGGVHHWIVDLRGNRGGELQATADALSVFTGGGELIYLRDRADKLYSAKSGYSKLCLDPAIVLVDGATASAGELYAAGIRDRQRGLLIGSRTYGKGVAQSAFDASHPTYGGAFADGSALLLTTEKAFSDALVSNNIMGVLPNLVVEADQAEGVARLLCADAPREDTGGYLRLHLARWRWYVDLAHGDREALRALLEALPPQAELYLGAGGPEGWTPTTPQAVAQAQGLSGYTPRRFPDVDASPYAQAINALRTYGILKGDEAGQFRPADGLDRASLCALLAQAMDYPPSAADPAFADTPADAWYTPYITTLHALGVVNGYDDGLFHPDDPIPHQQFMAILSRIVAGISANSYAAFQLGPDQAALADGDFSAYDPWAVKGAWLLDGAWFAPARDIDPNGVTTREEAAYCLWSALSTLGLIQG